MKRYAGMALGLCLLGVGVTGCIKDDYASKEKASVTLTFTTRALATEASAAGKLENNEQMTTLRVIVARTNYEILFNNVYSIEPNETSKTINYSELTINPNGEDINFYVIANEEGFLGSESLADITSGELPDLKDRILTNSFNVTPSVKIPQTAFKTLKVGPNEKQEETIPLDFVVAKVYVGFVNQTGAEQTITDLTLKASNPRQGYLFDPNDENRIPSGVTYNDLPIAESVSVAATATEDTPGVYAYLYPGNNMEQNAYVLQGNWNGQKTVDVKSLANGALDSGLQRGQQLNVIITLLGGENEYTVDVMVNAWEEEKVMDIEPFE